MKGVTQRVVLAALFLTAAIVIAKAACAQAAPPLPPWGDTASESGVVPVGEEVGVYRAALDLLYIDGPNHPSMIVMHDTAEGIADRPCRLACGRVWLHKSKIDTSAIIAYTWFSPKRPRIRDFGYRIPIVFISYEDREPIQQDGFGFIAAHGGVADDASVFRGGMSARYPGSWGITSLSKVAFNTAHDQALVAISHYCGGECGSTETLFLKRDRGRWTVIERIPSYADPSGANAQFRYVGPAGASAPESEIVGDSTGRSLVRSEYEDSRSIYRAILDSLYSFQGASPPVVLLTDRYMNPSAPLGKHKTPLDSTILQRNAFLELVRTSPDTSFHYGVPSRIVLRDSIPALEKLGGRSDTGQGLWLGVLKEFPGAWGMVGFSRVAFDLSHRKAMVYSNHLCGEGCYNGDTWILEKARGSWRVVERLPRGSDNSWDPELFPLRYIGLDAKPNSYRHRRVYARLTNAVTQEPLQAESVMGRGINGVVRELTTDFRGRIDFGVMPFLTYVGMSVRCPDRVSGESVYVGTLSMGPGADTTVNFPVDFRECLHHSESTIATGAEALISADDARLSFPFPASNAAWDLRERQGAATVSYNWMAQWEPAPVEDAEPEGFWITMIVHADSPVTSRGPVVDPRSVALMIPCTTCDENVFSPLPASQFGNVTTSVDRGRLVINVRGRDAIQKIFKTMPNRVSFRTHVESVPRNKAKPTVTDDEQIVFVNCRTSDSTAASRRHCTVPADSKLTSPRPDSSGRRRVRVVAVTPDGGSLVRNVDVRVTSEDLKTPPTKTSTGSAGFFTMLKSAPDSVRLDALCPTGQQSPSGQLALYLAPGRDTALQLIVDPRRCATRPPSN